MQVRADSNMTFTTSHAEQVLEPGNLRATFLHAASGIPVSGIARDRLQVYTMPRMFRLLTFCPGAPLDITVVPLQGMIEFCATSVRVDLSQGGCLRILFALPGA